MSTQARGPSARTDDILSNLANLSIAGKNVSVKVEEEDAPSPMSMVMVEDEDAEDDETDVLAFDSDFSDLDFSDNEGVSIAGEWQELSEVDVVDVADGDVCRAVECEEEEEERVAIARTYRRSSGKQTKPKTLNISAPSAAPVIKEEPFSTPFGSEDGSVAGAPLNNHSNDALASRKASVPKADFVSTNVSVEPSNPRPVVVKVEATDVYDGPSNPRPAVVKVEAAVPESSVAPDVKKSRSKRKSNKITDATIDVPAATVSSAQTLTRKKKAGKGKGKGKAAVATVKEEEIDYANLRPIEEYFAQYRSIYKFEPENTIIGEFRRLSTAMLNVGLQADRSMFCGATLREFRLGTEEKITELGLSGPLAHWHVVASELGASEVDLKDLKSKRKCLQWIKKRFVNIYDFVDARHKKQPLRMFKTHHELVAHIRKRKKAFDKNIAKQDDLLKAMLRMCR